MTGKIKATPSELAAWMNEHLSYELVMLRYGRASYLKITTREGQLDWNAYYEAFVVHARNLYAFLTNGKDAEFKAHDFVVGGFEAAKTTETINALNALHAQVLHMGRKRPPTGPGDKFNVENCEQLNSWIEENMRAFTRRLGEPYAEAWAKSDATAFAVTVPEITRDQLLVMTILQPSTTNSIIINNSGSMAPKDCWSPG